MTVSSVPRSTMQDSKALVKTGFPLLLILPWFTTLFLLGLWFVLSKTGVLPNVVFPAPLEVWDRLVEEVKTGRLFNDIIASLFRVSIAFVLAIVAGLPLGLLLGLNVRFRAAILPLVNFLRSLSPLAWIPFAVFWFQLGDKPSIFLIFMAVCFPIALATMAATVSIPTVYFRVARDHGVHGFALMREIVLPAILPQVITALRVGVGLSWLVVVAAEMLAGRDGLGYLVWDARNGVANDLLVVAMLVIGLIGMVLDRLVALLMRLSSVRWGYEA